MTREIESIPPIVLKCNITVIIPIECCVCKRASLSDPVEVKFQNTYMEKICNTNYYNHLRGNFPVGWSSHHTPKRNLLKCPICKDLPTPQELLDEGTSKNQHGSED